MGDYCPLFYSMSESVLGRTGATKILRPPSCIRWPKQDLINLKLEQWLNRGFWFLWLPPNKKKDEIHQGFSQVQMQFNAVLFSSAAFEENVHPGLTVII